MTRILITGASRGLGRALAVELNRRGYAVVATARQVSDLENLEAAAKVTLDVTDPHSVRAAAAEAGEIDVIINNAAVTVSAPVEAIPIDVAQKVFETNVLGPLRVMQAFLPGMRQRGRGMIINISSHAVNSSPPLQGIYTASKAALEKLSEVLHFEVQHFGVKVVVIPLGGVETEMTTRQQTFSLEPYAPLVEQQNQRYTYYREHGGGAAPEQIASAVADVVEQSDPPLRAFVDGNGESIVPEQMRRMARKGLDW